jgi:hypothetical protein
MVLDTLGEAIPTAVRLTTVDARGADSSWEAIVGDFKRVQHALDGVQIMVDRLMQQAIVQTQPQTAREQLLAARAGFEVEA